MGMSLGAGSTRTLLDILFEISGSAHRSAHEMSYNQGSWVELVAFGVRKRREQEVRIRRRIAHDKRENASNEPNSAIPRPRKCVKRTQGRHPATAKCVKRTQGHECMSPDDRRGLQVVLFEYGADERLAGRQGSRGSRLRSKIQRMLKNGYRHCGSGRPCVDAASPLHGWKKPLIRR